jgi:hypothetical protein
MPETTGRHLTLRLPGAPYSAPATPTEAPGLSICPLPDGWWVLARDPRGDALAKFETRAAAEQAARSLGDQADWGGPRKLASGDLAGVRFAVRTLGGTTEVGPVVLDGPLVGAALYNQVLTLAGRRCQCQGACGKKHAPRAAKAPWRCEHRQGQHVTKLGSVRLLAIPHDPSLPWHLAGQLPARRLIAFCPPCADGVRRAINRAAKAQPPQDGGLFDAEPYAVRDRDRGDVT